MLRTGMRSVVVAVVLAGCFRGDPPPPANPTITLAAPKPAKDRSFAIGDALGFLPGDAELAVVIDMKPLRASPLWPRFEPILRGKMGATSMTALATFVTTCNFDPLADLTWMAIGLRDLKANSPSGTFVIRGIDRDTYLKCIDAVGKANPSIQQSNGVVIVPGAAAMTFVDSRTFVVIIGPNANANTLRDVLDGGAPLRVTPWAVDLLSKVNTQDPAWLIYNGSAVMPSSRGVGGSIQVDDQGVGASFRLRFADDAAATSFATVLQSQMQGMQSMFTELTATPDFDEIALRIRATVAQMQTLLGLAGIP